MCICVLTQCVLPGQRSRLVLNDILIGANRRSARKQISLADSGYLRQKSGHTLCIGCRQCIRGSNANKGPYRSTTARKKLKVVALM